MQGIPDTVYTHAGKFHADDVFSAALLRILNPTVRICRTFDLPDDFAGFAFDIGFGRFDHHQADAPVRENGVPYAAFGLLWREYGALLVGEDEAARFDEHFVQPLDRDDNTGYGSPVAELIGNFNPSWDSQKDIRACFDEAVAFAGVILEKKLEAVRSIQRAKQMVQAALEQMQDGIVRLPQFAPWKMVLIGSEANFVVYPSQRGGYNAQCVPEKGEAGKLKCPFPQDWAGRPAHQLKSISGIPSLRFCHNNGFLITADTEQDAVEACRKAMERQHSADG